MSSGPRPRFELGDRVTARAQTERYDGLRTQQRTMAQSHDRLAADGCARPAVTATPALPPTLPSTRRLRIYTQDPATPRMHEPIAELAVPYEPLQPGPVGATVAVVDVNETTGETYHPLSLDDPGLALASGLKPSTTDPRFAQQMTYALCMATYNRFRLALGRNPQFSFPPHTGDCNDGHEAVKLHIRPHAFEEDNAYYDPDLGALLFGYTQARGHAQDLSQPGSLIFTSLSQDVVVHEMTHALLDGMRTRFMLPTNADVDGFHEGFADLIALFQRFSYTPLVAKAIAEAGGSVTSSLLTDIARQWGAATSDGNTPLRTALLTPGEIDRPVPAGERYRHDMEAHDMGAVLLRAVFDAYRFVFDRKTETLRGLAAHLSGPLPCGLVTLLADAATRLAEQFLNILIRAVDYCPPVDLRLGEYLRAMLTADYDLVPDDPFGYREALVRGFRRHGVTVPGVLDLTEDALLWRGPEVPLRVNWTAAISAAGSRVEPVHGRDTPRSRAWIARRIGTYITAAERLYYFGLAVPDAAAGLERPVIESVREIRRVGPDGNINVDIVAEVIQRRRVRRRWFYGGSTLVLGTDGRIRYVVAKYLNSGRREAQFEEFVERRREYRALFEIDSPTQAARFRRLHARRRRPNAES